MPGLFCFLIVLVLSSLARLVEGRSRYAMRSPKTESGVQRAQTLGKKILLFQKVTLGALP